MTKKEGSSTVKHEQHKQMLKMIAKNFYNEMVNYGVREAEVLSVTNHLLDNLMINRGQDHKENGYYNKLFTIKDVNNEWNESKLFSIQEVSISPIAMNDVPQIASWMQTPAISESFHPRFPDSVEELCSYFQAPWGDYFSIFYQQELAGIIGGERIDTATGKLEMRKFVGDPDMHGKGIGKCATFLFLYYVFMIRKFEKVFLHSLDTNIRNINLNRKFGFELEGVFFEDAMVRNTRRDVLRMALTAPVWLELFS